MCVYGEKIVLYNLHVVIPGSEAMTLPIAGRWADGLASHSDLCSARDVQKCSACENWKS